MHTVLCQDPSRQHVPIIRHGNLHIVKCIQAAIHPLEPTVPLSGLEMKENASVEKSVRNLDVHLHFLQLMQKNQTILKDALDNMDPKKTLSN